MVEAENLLLKAILCPLHLPRHAPNQQANEQVWKLHSNEFYSFTAYIHPEAAKDSGSLVALGSKYGLPLYEPCLGTAGAEGRDL